MTKQTLGRKRVLEIMKEEGMNTNSQMLVLDMNLMYLKGRQDLLQEEIEEAKQIKEMEDK